MTEVQIRVNLKIFSITCVFLAQSYLVQEVVGSNTAIFYFLKIKLSLDLLKTYKENSTGWAAYITIVDFQLNFDRSIPVIFNFIFGI